ncbi:MAG: adenosine deaminase [Alphaproteobacteria bacterium]|nr:MAG: adenosine deaminase [Alphaproteobacteria bacterium]
MRRNVLIGAIVAVAVAIVVAALVALAGDTAVTAARFSAIRSDHTALRAFLQRMPKGADLHVHLSGAVYAEDLIAWAKSKSLCASLPMKIVACSEPESQPIGDAFKNQPFYDDLVNALSMRFFLPNAENPSGHDQFFATFGRFGGVTWLIPAEMTAAMLRHYAGEAVQHTELMITLLPYDYGPKLLAAIARVSGNDERLQRLQAGDLSAAVAEASKTIDGWVKRIDEVLGCDAQRSQPGCAVSYKYIAQINRNADEANVFVQTAFAAALIRTDRRVAGLNFVGPEDYRVARADYARHMQMIGFLARDVPVALHAGELWIGLVPPEDLTFHIRQAVEVAGARRIGHGVALAYERRSSELLDAMRRKPAAVEVNLTSNDVILGVRGNDHPLMAYWAARVPVVLSTDDMGVSRIDLSNEYLRAARDYPLGYRELKKIARNSLDHSFLDAAEKDAQLRKFEQASAEFERAVASERGLLRGIGALIAGLFRWP